MSKDEIKLEKSAIDFLKEEVGGGSIVVANPELEGTEPNLEGLEVDGIKYKVPQGSGGIEYVKIDPDGGTLGDDDYQKLINGAYIKFGQNQEAEFNGSEVICLPNHSVDELVYSSVVKDGKYYQVEFTVVDHIEFECTYTITEHTLGGIEFINLSVDTTEIDLETARKLTGPNKNNYIIELNDNTETSSGIYLRPDGEYTNVWTSNIVDGSYWEFKITDWQEEGIYVSIEQISVGGGDNRFLGLGFELKSALNNKHLSVNALLSLLEKYGIDASNIYNLHIGSVIGNNGDNNEYELINACFDGSTSAVTILNETINDSEYYGNVNQGLMALKNLIEVTIIADEHFPMENLYCANLSTESDAEGSIFISPEEIYELFTQ